MKKTEVRGSFTLEAAFVMPVVVFVVLALFFLGYSLYDQCVWEERLEDGYLLANRWGLHPMEFDTGKPYWERINERGLFFRFLGGMEEGGDLFNNYTAGGNKNVFITEGKTAEAQLGTGGLTFKLEFERKIPGILKSFSSNAPRRAEGKIRLHHPAELVREYAALDELVEGTKGLSELKEGIGRLLNKIPE